MGSQQLCLKWENHQTNLLNGFESLLSNEFLVDVTLACEGQTLKVHKVVLSACSPFFQNLLIQNPCQHPIIILSGVKYSDLKSVIDFVYHGEINIDQDQLSAVLQTAELLKINGLAELNDKQENCNSEIHKPTNEYSNSMQYIPLEGKQVRSNILEKTNTSNKNSNQSDDNLNMKALGGIKQEIAINIEKVSNTEENTFEIESEESHFRAVTYPQIRNDVVSSSYHSVSTENTSTKSLDYILSQPSSSVIEEHSFSECSVAPPKILEQIPKQESISEVPEHLPSSAVALSHLSSVNLNETPTERNQIEIFTPLAGSSNYHHNKHLLILPETQMKDRSLISSFRWKSSNRSLQEDSVSRLRCLQCKKIFSTSSNLKRHMEIHVLERKTYKCFVCHKRFSWKTHLNSHLRRDHGYKT
ncbi:protein abrupt-like [Centruroides sculpturatus]|uniref:protein abrupt-like n=1 Tax=Centruroides sculpturatus TaxID=218467 RepID=UPI000C6EECFA|nr:protein abrupt-like [Centruroides sculpturatus]XP_023211778.1 protein abrupt-like [Centruroides sculpturatus]